LILAGPALYVSLNMLQEVLLYMDLKKRSDIHYARKIWHMMGVFVLFLTYIFLPYPVSISLIALAWVSFVTFDVLRQSRPALNEWAIHAFKLIMRESESNQLAGTTYLLTGVLILAAVFPRPVVGLTLLFLAFADPAASYFGIKYGKDKIFGHKSIQGFIAAFIVCVIVCILYFGAQNYMLDRIIVLSLFAGLIGAFSELIPVGKLDDNLSLPLMSAIGLTLLFYFFGFFANVG
jgi:diacylglycerol kinase (CTP)